MPGNPDKVQCGLKCAAEQWECVLDQPPDQCVARARACYTGECGDFGRYDTLGTPAVAAAVRGNAARAVQQCSTKCTAELYRCLLHSGLGADGAFNPAAAACSVEERACSATCGEPLGMTEHQVYEMMRGLTRGAVLDAGAAAAAPPAAPPGAP